MLCDQVREHLSAYLDKELTADLSAAVRAHLDACADCRTLADELRATADLLGRLPARPAPGHVADDVMREIERRGILAIGAPAGPEPGERTLPIRRPRLWPRALAVAATAVMAVGIGILAYLGEPSPKAPPAPGLEVAMERTDTSKVSEEPTSPSDSYVAARQKLGTGQKQAEKDDGSAMRQLNAQNTYTGGVTPSGGGVTVSAGTLVVAAGKAAGPAPSPPAPAAAAAAPAEARKAVAEPKAAAVDLAALAEAHGPVPSHAKSSVAPAEAATMYGAGKDAARLAQPARPPVVAEAPAAQAPMRAGKIAVVAGDGAARSGAAAGKPAAAKAPDGGLQVVTEDRGAAAGERKTKTPADERRDAAALEQTLLAAAAGEVGIERLSEAATGDAVRDAGSQLVLQAESSEAADRNLVELFKASGWRPLAVDRERAADKVETTTFRLRREAPAADAAGTVAGGPAAGGVYYRATRNGEDVWLVLADRDSISRFGSRLAQAQGLTVAGESSAEFRAIRWLQEQLRQQSELAKAEKFGGRSLDLKHFSAAAAAAPPAAPLGVPAAAPSAAPAGTSGREQPASRSPAVGAEARKLGVTSGGGRQSGGGGGAESGVAGGAPLMGTTASFKAKTEEESQSQAEGLQAGAHDAKPQTGPAPADRILLVIRVQPVLASRAEAERAAPAATQPAEKTAP